MSHLPPPTAQRLTSAPQGAGARQLTGTLRCLGALLLACALPAQQLVLNHNQMAEPIDRQRALDLFLGASQEWQDKSRVTLVVCEADDQRDAIHLLCGRRFQPYLRGWKRLVFSGSGAALPVVVKDRAELLREVARNPGWVGLLVDAGAPTGLRVVPLDQGPTENVSAPEAPVAVPAPEVVPAAEAAPAAGSSK